MMVLGSGGFQSIVQMSYGIYFHGNLFTLILVCTVLRPIKQCQSKFDPIQYFWSLFPFHFQGRGPLFWLMKCIKKEQHKVAHERKQES
jgi:hypothetical protein